MRVCLCSIYTRTYTQHPIYFWCAMISIHTCENSSVERCASAQWRETARQRRWHQKDRERMKRMKTKLCKLCFIARFAPPSTQIHTRALAHSHAHRHRSTRTAHSSWLHATADIGHLKFCVRFIIVNHIISLVHVNVCYMFNAFVAHAIPTPSQHPNAWEMKSR